METGFPSNFIKPPAGAWQVGGPNSLHFVLGCRSHSNGTATPPPHSFSDQDSQCPLCGPVVDRVCDRAAVCSCAGDLYLRHNAVAHVFHEAARLGSRPPTSERESRTLPAPSRPTDFHKRPASTVPPMCGFSTEKTWSLKAWDFTVTSCCFPARNRSPTTGLGTWQTETLKRTFHHTVNRCHQKGIRFTHLLSADTLEGGGLHTQLCHLNPAWVTWDDPNSDEWTTDPD